MANKKKVKDEKPETKKMLTEDFVRFMADKCDIPIKQSWEILEVVRYSLLEAMKEDNTILIKNLGVFSVIHRPERISRNVYKNESITAPPSTVPHFKFSKTFKDEIKGMTNGGETDK